MPIARDAHPAKSHYNPQKRAEEEKGAWQHTNVRKSNYKVVSNLGEEGGGGDARCY